MSVTKRCALEERDFLAFAENETFREGGRFRASTLPDLRNPRQVDSGENANGSAANVDDLDGAPGIGVTVGLFVNAVKCRNKPGARGNAEFVGLTDVPDIEPMLESLLRFPKAFPSKEGSRFPLQMVQSRTRQADCLERIVHANQNCSRKVAHGISAQNAESGKSARKYG
jgi:hypothetical protein